MQVSAEVEARFWARVDKTPGHGPKGQCWIYSRQSDPERYAKFTWRQTGKKQQMDAHRFVLCLKLGRVPNGLATHSCDYRPCCNPEHINKGTYSTNRQECVERGRNGKTPIKFSVIQITEMRRLVDVGYSMRRVAKSFKCSHRTVGRIVHRSSQVYD